MANGNRVVNMTIGLEYLSGSFDTDELAEIEKYLNEKGLSFRTRETRPRMIMGIEELFPQIRVYISPDIVNQVDLGIATNLIYDVLKYLFWKIKTIVCSRRLIRMRGSVVEKDVVADVRIEFGKAKISLPADLPDDKFQYFVDKLFDSLDAQTVIKEKYIVYDETENKMTSYTKEQFIDKARMKNHQVSK